MINGSMVSIVRCMVLALLLIGVAQIANAGESVRYVHSDALGSPVAYSDESGVIVERVLYDPYGSLIGAAATDKPAFTGHVADSMTGLSYMQQRYFDPLLGVFVSTDPVGVDTDSGGLFNRYMYSALNPYTFVDPDGRCTGSRITNSDGTCKSTGGNTTASGPTSTELEVPKASAPGASTSVVSGGDSNSNWLEIKSRLGLSGDLTKNGNIFDFGALFHDVAIPAMYSRGGAGLAAAPVAIPMLARFNFAVRAEHVFRNASGHVNPASLASKMRFVGLFQRVGSNPANIRVDAVAAKLMTRHAEAAGVSTYTQTMRNGSQVWVQVRNGEIVNAGVNVAGKAR